MCWLVSLVQAMRVAVASAGIPRMRCLARQTAFLLAHCR